jgi:hypothetical protein
MERISSKYKEYYSNIISQAEGLFISKLRKKEGSPNNRNKKNRNSKHNYIFNETEIS